MKSEIARNRLRGPCQLPTDYLSKGSLNQSVASKLSYQLQVLSLLHSIVSHFSTIDIISCINNGETDLIFQVRQEEQSPSWKVQ